MLFLNNRTIAGTPTLRCAMGTSLGFGYRVNRDDLSEFADLLVVTVAVALAGTFHRSRNAAFDLARSPLFRPANHFFNVLYLAVRSHLIVVANAVTERVSRRPAALNAASRPFLFTAEALSRHRNNFAMFSDLLIVRRAIAISESFCARRLAAIYFAAGTLFSQCGVMAGVLRRVKRHKVFDHIIRVIMIFVMNVKGFSFFAITDRNRTVVLNPKPDVIGHRLAVKRSEFSALPSARPFRHGSMGIAVPSPSLVVHRAKAAAEGSASATVDCTRTPLVFPCSFGWHRSKLYQSLKCNSTMNFLLA